MRKLLPYFFGFLTLLWLIGGTYWYQKKYCGSLPNNTNPVPTIVNNQTSFTSNTDAPIVFTFGQARPVFLTESIVSLKKKVDEINKNGYKKLIIKGLYSQKETNGKPSINLGLKRAEAIKEVIKELGAIDADIQVQSERSENIHFVNNQLQDGINMSIVENTNKKFEGLNLYYPNKTYRFKETTELDKYFKDLKEFMVRNPNVVIQIQSKALNTEGGKISQLRINYMKNYLSQMGLNVNQISFKASKEKKKNKPLIEVRKS